MIGVTFSLKGYRFRGFQVLCDKWIPKIGVTFSRQGYGFRWFMFFVINGFQGKVWKK